MDKFPCTLPVVSPLYMWKRSVVTPIQEEMYEPVTYQDNKTNYVQDEPLQNLPKVAFKPPGKPPRKHKMNKQVANEKGTEELETLQSEKGGTQTETGDVDMNHINFETTKNYINKYRSFATQVTAFPPYRLRVFPKGSKIKYDPEQSGCSKERFHEYCQFVGRCILSQFGLIIILSLWALLGAAAFYETEGPREREQAKEVANLQDEIEIALSTELRQVLPQEPKWRNTVKKYLEQHETVLTNAVCEGYGQGGGGSIWTYPGCILFAVSLLTTLGFGSPVPRTFLGRGSAVLFAVVGIPLHFLLILNVGTFVARQLQQYGNVNDTSISSKISPGFLRSLPIIAILVYYLIGVILFGAARQRGFLDSLMFPLDFTASGGVAQTLGHVRIFYALYLECAVTLAAIAVSIWQQSASNTMIDFGLRLGLLTNT